MFLEMRVDGIAMDPSTKIPIIILKACDDERKALPIWIGMLEASAIVMEMEKVSLSRPMTHDLMKKILVDVGVSVTRVEVVDLRDNVFYAVIRMKAGEGTELVVDARPSDAIAIALRMGAPIMVESSVIDRAAVSDMRTLPVGGTDGAGGFTEEMLEALSADEFGKYKM